MYFKTFQNIQTSFQMIRWVAFISIIASALSVMYTVYNCRQLVAEQREKIYVLDNGKSLILALQQDLKQNRPVEMKNHVKTFHEFFFTLSPDAAAVKYNIARALHLADKSVFKIYEDLQEAGFYSRLISTNTQQRIVFDSIDIQYEDYPYKANVWAQLYIVRESNVTVRNLLTICEITNVTRSDNNPHGFLMENFKVIKNENIETQKK